MSGDSTHSTVMKPLLVLAVPGMYLMDKYNQFKQQRSEQKRRKYAEKELRVLNQRIDKLLELLESQPREDTCNPETECVVCMDAPASMTTYPCNHNVICRRCFVKTIQIAVCQRSLPLRCVLCRTRILKLKQTSRVSVLLDRNIYEKQNCCQGKKQVGNIDNMCSCHRDDRYRRDNHNAHTRSHPLRLRNTSDSRTVNRRR